MINKIEEKYFEVQPFVDEWKLLKQEDPMKKKWRDRYTELGFIEQGVPIAFVGLYLILTAYLAAR